MKNKVWSLVLVLVVALCAMVFVACGGQTPGANVSLSVSSGLDSELDGSTLLNLSNELSLSENEKVSLGSGMGYDKKISSGKVVTLVVGSEDFSSRELIIKINGYEESMGQLISLSSDSANITFSDIEYLSGGRAKVTITGLKSGTAEVTARSGQYSKQTTFTVKVLERPNSFTVKAGAVIYLEKNSVLTIRAEDYVNFYPSTTNMKDLEVFNGTTLLTKNGVTTLSSITGHDNAITKDTILTIKSTRMQKEDNAQHITVKVVDEISSIGLKKLVYTENGTPMEEYQSINKGEPLTVIKNSMKAIGDKTISYGIRDVYVIVQNQETNLKINSKVFVNGEETDIICLPVDYELITNWKESNYGGMIAEYIAGKSSYSVHVYKFQFQYTGYDSYKVEFSFGVENYVYSEKEELGIDFRSASNLVEFRKSTEDSGSNEYTIYDGYAGVYGTRFVAKTNTGTLAYTTFQLIFDEDTKESLTFLTTTGAIKKPVSNEDKFAISLTNGENFYIRGNENSAGDYQITLRVTYIHEGITFETSKNIDIHVQKAPSSVKFNKDSESGESVEEYNFDLNSSGFRVGVNGGLVAVTNTSALSLYLYSYDSQGNLIGQVADFGISNSSSNISVTKDEHDFNKINIVAKSVGKGSFSVILGNNVRAVFNFEVVQSVSEFKVNFPDESQNNNVFSLRKDYTLGGETYNNYLIALTNKSIRTLISKKGNVESVKINCVEDSKTYVVYSNEYLKTTQDFENKVAEVTISYKYINSENKIQTETVIVDNILITSITTISSFNLTTSKNSTSFNLYDQSSVGYYARDLATATVYVDILPANLKELFLGEIEWVTNIADEEATETETTSVITTDIFVFTYYKAAGTATLTCNISKSNYDKYYDAEGKFTGGTIVLTAKIDRGDYGIYTKSLQFNVIRSEQVDVILTNVNELWLDEYSNSFDLFVNLFPSTAVNKGLVYQFIPLVDEEGNKLENDAINWEEKEGKLEITLKSQKAGRGILRIIAADSYIDAENYTKWVDVAINVSDGSIKNPYNINSIETVEKMIATNFAKHYVISGSLDLSKIAWELSSYTLTGSIKGINNAELSGFTISNSGENSLGLFKEIETTGLIQNIKISGTINTDFQNQNFDNPIYVGLLAGVNKGTIANVYVEINGGTIRANGNYNLGIGGVVGLNTGKMKTEVSKTSTNNRMVKFKNILEFIDTSTLSSQHTLYIGGVAGVNDNGVISRDVLEGLVDFNNGYATSEVYINAYYERFAPLSGRIEGIGGVCGISKSSSVVSSGGLFGVSAYGEIKAGKFNSSKTEFEGHFNNVGGLVGQNELTVNVGGLVGQNELTVKEKGTTNPEAQVYVRGRYYVGGAFGINKGDVKNIRVEVVETKQGNDYRKGLDASFIIGENYVGGIAGDQNSGKIESSSFISYLTRIFIKFDSSETTKDYFGDIVVIENSGQAMWIGLLFGNQIGNQSEEIVDVVGVVGIGNIQFVSMYSVSVTLSTVNGNNAGYGEFRRGDSSEEIEEGLAAVYETPADLKAKSGFKFIYLPPTEIGLKLSEKNENEMKTDNDDDSLAFYLFYYESSNDNVTNEIINKGLNFVNISSYINIEDLKKCSFSISNPSLLEIDNGQFKIKGTGYVTITATTPYNIDLEEVFYIYIVNYTDNLSAYFSSTKNREDIKQGDKIEFDATESVMIYFNFINKYNNQTGGYNLTTPIDIKVLAKVEIENETFIIKAGELINQDTGFGLIRISEDAYQFVVDGKIIDSFTSITFIPYIEQVFDGKTYTTYLTNEVSKIIKTEYEKVIDQIELSSNLTLNEKVAFEYRLTNVTRSINLSKESITTEPYYETSLEVLLNSLNEDERLTIRISMIDEKTGIVDTSFIKNWIKIVARYGDDTFENGSKELRQDTFSIPEINAKENNKLTLTFRFEEGYRDFAEKRVFIVTFTTSNYKTAQLKLTFEPQKAITINSTLYDWKTTSDNQYGLDESFSYVPSSVMIPGQISLIEFNIVPSYTNYAYVEVVNTSSNEVSLLFDLFNRTTETGVVGADQISGGVRIPKALIDNGKFYLRSFLSESISDDTTLSVKIVLKDKNGKIIQGSEQIKEFFIQHLPGVRLTVDGVNSGNTEDSRLSLARGLSYDLTVSVKGYLAGNLVKNGNTYTDGELIFEISENPNLISIIKNTDGTYKLVVNSDKITGTGSRKVCITTYGQRTTPGGILKSKEVQIYLNIEEFVVKSPQGSNDIIKDVISDIYPSAIGNSYKFEVSLNNDILKYDTTNIEIVQQVIKFLESLSTGVIEDENTPVWSYQDLSKTSTTWAKVSSTNRSFKDVGTTNIKEYKTENGVFTFQLDTGTHAFSVIFNKTESFRNPTFKFKYNASYYYNDGVPTLATQSTNGKPIFHLKQEFAFDIYEKTDLRNPYPIYSVEGLLDMREGNYYILLEDITLPANFQPIETKIGGLDGNNHRIIIPNIDILSTVENEILHFGLFAETTESTLLENIILYINGTTRINIQNFSTVTYGLLAGINRGQITNCAIEGINFPLVEVNLFGLSDPGSVRNEVGGLVGINYGNITHSRVEAGISLNGSSISRSKMPANLGGITAINKNGATIASSYVNARVANNTSSTIAKTGGVVSVNDLGGRIFTTYISGKHLNIYSVFADEGTVIVYSDASAGAFIYENLGEISNSYANIGMKTTGVSSGFVYENKKGGLISYCYSTSIMEEDAGNSAFVGRLIGVVGNAAILNEGTFKECYALGANDRYYQLTQTYETYNDETYNIGTVFKQGNGDFFDGDKFKSGVNAKEMKFNYGIGSNKGFERTTGLEIIDYYEFTYKDKFSAYAFSKTAYTDAGVWFWASGSTENSFIRNGAHMTFKATRPELVAPNTIGAGSKTFNYSEFDEATGITKYHYYEDSNNREGTKFNPFIIATTEDVEYMKQDSVNFVIGAHYYRIVCDLIYQTSTLSSGLYKYSFLGTIEGNGFTIGNYVLDSAEFLDSAGFFSSIGTQSSQKGSLKNIIFAPRYISLTNANSVGAVAGKAYSTTLVNIMVDGFSYSSSPTGVVILGKNCVGGVIGMALGNYSFNEVSASISVNSTYRAGLNGHQIMSFTDGDYKKVSYTGLIVGVLDGYGKLIHIDAFGDNVSIAENAGLMFGYVGKNVLAEILGVSSSSKQYIKASVYGGVIAGHNDGRLFHITIIDTNNKNSFFISEDYVPIAVGNIVGLMTGGEIKDAKVNAKLQVPTGIKYVGGAVGIMKAGTLEEIEIKGDIVAGATIGGLVGQIYNMDNSWKVIIIDSYHNGGITSTSSDVTVRVGTIIGYAAVKDNKVKLETIAKANGTYTLPINLLNINILIPDADEERTYTDTTINVNNHVYSKSLQIWVGIIIHDDSIEGSGNRGALLKDYNPLISSDDNGDLNDDFKEVYNVNKSSRINVASSLEYKLNGVPKNIQQS